MSILATAASAGFRGQVYVAVPAERPRFLPLGETRDSTLTVNQAEIDATSYDSQGWMEYIAGLKSWELSTESLYLANNNPGNPGQLAVWDALIAAQVLLWRFVPKNQAGLLGYQGSGFATSFEVNPPVDDAVTLSLSIIGTGPIATYKIEKGG
ncbi:MAG: hypothetical protein CML24_06665 [Rhizobiales bacterium]|nr:hypothetical protein [Hyphomicrobiales bacterium]